MLRTGHGSEACAKHYATHDQARSKAVQNNLEKYNDPQVWIDDIRSKLDTELREVTFYFDKMSVRQFLDSLNINNISNSLLLNNTTDHVHLLEDRDTALSCQLQKVMSELELLKIENSRMLRHQVKSELPVLKKSLFRWKNFRTDCRVLRESMSFGLETQ